MKRKMNDWIKIRSGEGDDGGRMKEEKGKRRNRNGIEGQNGKKGEEVKKRSGTGDRDKG